MNCFARHALLLLAAALVAWGSLGCKSADSDNVSSRPWNAPRGFDTGLPGYDNYQRR